MMAASRAPTPRKSPARFNTGIRGEFARTLNETRRDEVAASIARRVFDDARTDSLVLFDGRDLDVTPRLWARVTADNTLRNVGDRRMLPLRLSEYAAPQMIARLEDEQPRRFPIDAERVFQWFKQIAADDTEFIVLQPSTP